MRHLLERDRYGYAFDADAEPAITVRSGDTITVQTYDCFTNKVSSPAQLFHHDSDVLALIGDYNPVAGPIAVDGARPGDRLCVRIDAIELGTYAPYAATIVTVGGKGICGRPSSLIPAEASTRICELEPGVVVFPTTRGALRLPTRPMVGSIGTAPPAGAASSLEFGPDHGGNVDCPDLTVGATIVLPVNVPGALLWLGDVHAAMGDAEITGTALETNADVTITVGLLPGQGSAGLRTPRLDDGDSIGSLGAEFGAPLSDNLHRAFTDLIDRLTVEYGLTAMEAYQLAGAGARVTVDQCVDGGWTATRVRLPRSYLPPAIAVG